MITAIALSALTFVIYVVGLFITFDLAWLAELNSEGRAYILFVWFILALPTFRCALEGDVERWEAASRDKRLRAEPRK